MQRIVEAYQPLAGLPVGGDIFFHQITVGIKLAAVNLFAVDVRQAVRRAEVLIVIPVDLRFLMLRQGIFVAINKRQRAVAARFIQERLPVALVILTLRNQFIALPDKFRQGAVVGGFAQRAVKRIINIARGHPRRRGVFNQPVAAVVFIQSTQAVAPVFGGQVAKTVILKPPLAVAFEPVTLRKLRTAFHRLRRVMPVLPRPVFQLLCILRAMRLPVLS